MAAAGPTSSEQQAMQIRVQPDMSDWRLRDAEQLDASQLGDRASLLEQCDVHAKAYRWPSAVSGQTRNKSLPRIIATGHQAQPWHPGILAKDLSAIVAAEEYGATPLHVVVDQDEHPVWQIDLPRAEGERVAVKRHTLPQPFPGVPTGFQPPVKAERLAEWLSEAGLAVPPRLEGFRTLAQQVSGVLDHWRAEVFGVAGRLPIVFTSDLVKTAGYSQMVDQLRDQALQAVSAYNRAVYAVPEARLRPLAITREWVELPLWACRWEKPRQRVYADLGDSQPILVDETGEPIDRDSSSEVTLMPRALLMTAMLRQTFCDLFIHGTGGGTYDRVTEQWWNEWQRESLVPMATVTADLHLTMDLPQATPSDVARAVWYRHHLPFNINRFAEVDPELAKEKHQLLERMDDDRDKDRRSKAFYRIHDINQQFVRQHPKLMKQAESRVEDARMGLSNRRTLGRRDWCFALYPHKPLQQLRDVLAACASAAAPEQP